MFTLTDIRSFIKIKNENTQLQQTAKTLNVELQTLQTKLARVQQKLNSVQGIMQANVANINTSYGDLNKAQDIFQLATITELPTNKITKKHYVTIPQKESLFLKIVSDYKTFNPNSQNIPYTWVRNRLSEKYSINTKNIGSFFQNVLSSYKKTGGNRNKSIVISH